MINRRPYLLMKHSSILDFFSTSVAKSINSDYVIKCIMIDTGCNFDNGRCGPKVKPDLRLKEIEPSTFPPVTISMQLKLHLQLR